MSISFVAAVTARNVESELHDATGGVADGHNDTTSEYSDASYFTNRWLPNELLEVDHAAAGSSTLNHAAPVFVPMEALPQSYVHQEAHFKASERISSNLAFCDAKRARKQLTAKLETLQEHLRRVSHGSPAHLDLERQAARARSKLDEHCQLFGPLKRGRRGPRRPRKVPVLQFEPSSELSASELASRIAVEEIYASGLYDTCHRAVSKEELSLLEADGGCSAYGDTDVDIVTACFESLRAGVRLGENDVFYDLGSGDGRLVLSLALHSRVGHCVGVELCPTRHAQAVAAKVEATRRGLQPCDRVELCCASMLEHDLRGATCLFSYNLPEPGGSFLYAMKRHLLCTLEHGAHVLLRGQRFPSCADEGAVGAPDAISFLRDRSSWAVRLLPTHIRGEPSADVVRAQFRRLEPFMKTRVVNRMFQCVGYKMVVKHYVDLVLGARNESLGRERSGRLASDALPAAVDEYTQGRMDTDSRVGHAVDAWIDAACAALEAAEGGHDDQHELRTLELMEVREKLGQSGFERSLLEPADAGDESPPLVIWDLPDDFN